jgi:hypothetical protein
MWNKAMLRGKRRNLHSSEVNPTKTREAAEEAALGSVR